MLFYNVSQCLTCVSWCFTMFNNASWCLPSRATNAVAGSAPAGRRSRKRRRDRRRLCRNRRQLRRNRQWHRRNRRYRRERDPMLNSVLNGDWSNSVTGRKIPEGAAENGHGPGQGDGKVRVIGPNHLSHGKWWKACINICNHILKFLNCVLVRVPINNNNYEQPIVLFVILLAKNKFTMV